LLQRALAIEVPTLQKMVEIETSSRLYRVGDALFLTVPIASRNDDGSSQSNPLAFVVTRDVLLTVRFDPMKLCDGRAGAVETNEQPVAGGLGALIALVEALVDHIADDLESVTSRLDTLSRSIFVDPESRPVGRPPGTDKNLRGLLTRIGRVRGFTSLISETLLVLMRLSRYVASEAADRLDAPAHARLDRIGLDAASLNDHEARLSEKIQLLLDATLGLIGVDQNDIFKILTMVSVVGIPPTLLASMYGMNFKNMPEYDWAYGYQYGLFVIFMSALVPLLWFKWRRWW
jgi:magnesium transporter